MNQGVRRTKGGAYVAFTKTWEGPARPDHAAAAADLRDRLAPVVVSKALQRWMDNYSQSAAVDMCEGGDDAESVVEMCLAMCHPRFGHPRALRDELDALFAAHEHDTVMAELAKHVRTL